MMSRSHGPRNAVENHFPKKRDATMSDMNPKPVAEYLNLKDFAAFGEGEYAYVRPILSQDVPHILPDAPAIAPGLQLFMLLSADGTPIVLANSRDAAIANAWDHDLQMVNVH
jgi:hypothetical protein